MIPPQELRIGNYVLWQGKIVEVISIMPRWACVRDDEVTFSRSYEEFQPVPITEELLKEFGFEPDSITGIYVKWKRGTFAIWQAVNEQTFLLDNIKNKKVYLKYVHKLQNCHYELEGEELKRKEFEE